MRTPQYLTSNTGKGWGQQLPPGLSGIQVVGWFTLEDNARPGVVSMCPCSLVMCLTLGRSAYGGNCFDPS